MCSWRPMVPGDRGTEDFEPLIGQAGPDARRFEPRAPAELFDARWLDTGERETLEAGARAEALLQEARIRAERLEKEAFEKGYAQGERAGREMMERSMESALRALEAALEAWRRSEEDRIREMEEEIVRLALAVARKVVRREVKTDPQLVCDVVRSALTKGQTLDEVVVRVNPLDRGTLLDARPGILRELEELRSMKIEGDESIERGGAVVECAMGELDVRLERQLQEVGRAFERLLGDRPADGGRAR